MSTPTPVPNDQLLSAYPLTHTPGLPLTRLTPMNGELFMDCGPGALARGFVPGAA